MRVARDCDQVSARAQVRCGARARALAAARGHAPPRGAQQVPALRGPAQDGAGNREIYYTGESIGREIRIFTFTFDYITLWTFYTIITGINTSVTEKAKKKNKKIRS